MSEQYGQYGQPETQYEVSYPPLGQPLPAPPPAAAPPPTGRPGIATAAAVLALVEAGLLGLLLLVSLIRVGVGETPVGDGAAGTVLGLLGSIALVALLVIGALFLLRGTGRLLLLVTTWLEVALVVAVTLWLIVALSGVNDVLGIGAAFAIGVLVVALLLLALPVVRLVLGHRPSVAAWVAAAREERARPPAPVWSPAAQQWMPGQPRGAGAGAVLAVVLPAAVLAVVAAVVVTQAGGSPLADPYAGSTGSLYGQPVPDSRYAGSSSWGYQYYRDGAPLPPPPAGSALYDPQYAALAESCADGSMNQCDQLYFTTPVGDFYEWFGSSCAGRLDHETSGGCASSLGSFVD